MSFSFLQQQIWLPKFVLLGWILLLVFIQAALTGRVDAQPTKPLRAADVVILYHAELPQSRQLAEHYALARSIPEENLIGLNAPKKDLITRSEFEEKIAQPLRAELSKRNWWRLREVPDSPFEQVAVSKNKQLLLLIKGIPRRISEEGEKKARGQENAASVDSELVALGLVGTPIEGLLNNPYYKKKASFREFNNAPFFLVGRLDGPSFEVAKRMVDDALAVEQTGLWGNAFVDQDDMYEQGTQWLAQVASDCTYWGFPLIVEPTTHTFASHFPMQDAALYYGWYDGKRSGPLLNEAFRFKRGAVAVHIHSFSARSLAAEENWCGPLLDHGAAATLGNVFEPYLEATHNLDIFNQRLLEGYSLVEASQMSVPVLSWMWTCLGDPLYRPFARAQPGLLKPTLAQQSPWHRLRILALDHPQKLTSRLQALEKMVVQNPHPVLWEALAALQVGRGVEGIEAAMKSLAAAAAHPQASRADQLRFGLTAAYIEQLIGKQEQAKKRLEALAKEFADIPEARAASVMQGRLAR